MEVVGVRELRENLSRYLKRIKSGESIIVSEGKNVSDAVIEDRR